MTPGRLRRPLLAACMAMGFVLYLDRICIATIVKAPSFTALFDRYQTGRILGVFFFGYALCQLPAGWASDRFGPRGALTLYIVLWSALTALTGLVASFAGLLAVRALCGAAEAGAFPACSALIRRWFPWDRRGRASACVTAAARLGGTVAPFLTAWLVVSLGRWRPVLWIDGGAGLVVALIYFSAAPSDRRRRSLRPASAPLLRSIRVLAASRNVWLLCGVQLCINLGWAFLITWLPTVLGQRGVGDVEAGRLATLVLGCGAVGQIAGGFLTDLFARRFGLRTGRILSIAGAAALAAIAYFSCLAAHTAAAIAIGCALASFFNDTANPANWAIFQDIGGGAVASVTGWCNMWGNFGAAASAVVLSRLGTQGVFTFCGLAMLAAALLALGLNAQESAFPQEPSRAAIPGV